MKALKLDARFEGARKLAECLVGSPCQYRTEDRGFEHKRSELLGQYGYKRIFAVTDTTEDYYRGDFGSACEATLPLETIKFCPFIAMKNRISVFAPKGNARGRITCIDDCESVQIGWNPEAYFLHEIELDTNNLPEGAEIIEL